MDRPILFSAPMVAALLDGRKTQTRRVVTPQPKLIGNEGLYWEGGPQLLRASYGARYVHTGIEECKRIIEKFSPYGVPGDRLWVKETFQEVHPCQIACGRFSKRGQGGIPGPPPVEYRVIYRADGEYPKIHFLDKYPYRHACIGPGCTERHVHPEENYNGWKPSIFLPKRASRITLEITSIRVERLHDISEEDSKAEGIPVSQRATLDRGDKTCKVCGDHENQHLGRSKACFGGLGTGFTTVTFKGGYKLIWEQINGLGSWAINPYVLVIEFKKL